MRPRQGETEAAERAHKSRETVFCMGHLCRTAFNTPILRCSEDDYSLFVSIPLACISSISLFSQNMLYHDGVKGNHCAWLCEKNCQREGGKSKENRLRKRRQSGIHPCCPFFSLRHLLNFSTLPFSLDWEKWSGKLKWEEREEKNSVLEWVLECSFFVQTKKLCEYWASVYCLWATSRRLTYTHACHSNALRWWGWIKEGERRERK